MPSGAALWASFFTLLLNVLVSARKYETNGGLRGQLANLTAFILCFLKPPPRIARTYKAPLNYR